MIDLYISAVTEGPKEDSGVLNLSSMTNRDGTPLLRESQVRRT